MKIAKTLKNGETEQHKIVDLFKQLNQIDMNMEILTKTKIGAVVNEFRKSCKDDKCKSLAKNLIKRWKKNSSDEQTKQGKKSETRGEHSARERADESIEKSEDSREPGEEISEDGRTWPSNPYNLHPSVIKDDLRLNMRKVLTDALKCPKHRGMNFELVAGAIEDAVYDNAKDTGTKYVITIRSKILSIKCNKPLKQKILDGEITPENYSVMDYKDYASEKMKKHMEEVAKEERDKKTFSTSNMGSSTLYKCGKCGARDTTYTQAQTRSADEPMTTFITCNKCGKRWKQ